jgi:hypothetical protein
MGRDRDGTRRSAQLTLPVEDGEHLRHDREDEPQRHGLHRHSRAGQSPEPLSDRPDHRAHPRPIGGERHGVPAAGVDAGGHRGDEDCVRPEPARHVGRGRHREARRRQHRGDHLLPAVGHAERRRLLCDTDVLDRAVVASKPTDAGKAEHRPVAADSTAHIGGAQRVVLQEDHGGGPQGGHLGEDPVDLVAADGDEGQVEARPAVHPLGHVHPDPGGPAAVHQGDSVTFQGAPAGDQGHLVTGLPQPARVDPADHSCAVDQNPAAHSGLHL